MAMNPKCIQAVNQAAGRELTDGQLRKIEDRLAVAQRRLARQDPQAWGAMSAEQRMLEGAKIAQQELHGEAARKVANAQRQILATSATDGRIADLGTNMKASRTRALVEDINNTAHYIEGVKRENASQLVDLIEAASSGEGATGGRRVLQFLFDVDNPAMTRDLVGEIFGNGAGKTGNQIAKQGAQAWLKVIEGMRTRFNAAGGDVGKLEYGYLPQPHDAVRVGAAGADGWAAKTMPLLDRSQYLREDGTRMNDAEVLDFLKAAWETIRSDGMNKQTPGQFKGPGARANSGSESRQIHFKDGEAYLAYNADFGAGSMYDAMIGHVGAMARTIGMVERYGPNPNQQFNLQRDLAQRADGDKRVFANRPQAYWDILTGTANAPQAARLAEVGQGIRNIQTFGKLAGAVLSSVTDLGTSIVTAGYNKLSYWDWLKNTATAGGKDAKAFMNTHGMIAESMLSDLNRWSGDHLQQGWTSRLANSTMKLSLMNAWTDTVRRGFSMTMMQGLGKMSGKKWADLTEWDRSHLGRKGITEADWAVVNQAQLTDFNGTPMLTPEAIAASGDARAGEVTAKILGFITDESEYAVINPDMATKAVQTWGGLQTGTGAGELARLTMQFKSFPIAMISRHWRRMLEGDRGLDGAPALANKMAYTAALMLTTTALGAIAFQAKQVVQGKDPVDMTTGKFWSRAFAQGGGLGFMGDIILGDTTQDRSPLDSLGRLLLGPTFGSAADAWELTKGNVDEAMAGKATHAGAESLRFGQSHLPYINLWYAKAALNHAFLHAVQENLSPGYLARQRKRAAKDWEQDYWWEPGEAMPDRAPDLSTIGGR
jgi:hypothetical protein